MRGGTERPRPPRRGAVVGGVLAALAIAVALIVLLSPTGWRTVQIANVIPGGPVATLDRPGDRICVGLSEVPTTAGFAEVHLQGEGAIAARLSVLRGERTWEGPVQRVAIEGGIARFALPPGAASPDPSFVCLSVARRGEHPVTALGTGKVAALRLVGHAPQSRLAQLPAMLDRVGVGTGSPLRAFDGWLLAVVVLATLGGALVVIVRGWTTAARPGRRAWIALAVIGVLHAWTWAALTPAFQVPDESSHFSYATYVADHGRLPEGKLTGSPPASRSQQVLEQQLQVMTITFRPTMRPAWAESADLALHRALDETARTPGSLDVPDVNTNATGQPPLYYLSVAPAALGASNALDQLARMRLLSGLWMALAVLGAVALVRWLVPERPRWALTTGLTVALLPLLGFVAGGVNPDVAMTALAFWTFAAAVRCWRRGLTPRNVALFGVMAVLLMLTKLTGIAIVPGAALIVLAAALRARRAGEGRAALRALAIGVGVAAIPLAIYALITVLSGRPIVPGVIGATATQTAGGGAAAASGPGRTTDLVNTVWQLFLPRIPGTSDAFAGVPLWTIWADGLAGRFGYLDYAFEPAVRRVIVGGWLAVVLAAWVGFARMVRLSGLRDVLRGHGPVMLGGAVAIGLLLVVIGVMDYNSRSTHGPPFQQARYLLPGLPVAVIALPLALRAFGRAWRPTVAILGVGLMVAWLLGAFGLTLVRYYG